MSAPATLVLSSGPAAQHFCDWHSAFDMAPVKPRPVGRPRLGGKGRHHTKYTVKSISVAKKLEVLAFWASAPVPKMRHTIAHFWHDLAPEYYNSKRTMIQRWRRDSAKLEAALKGQNGGHLKVRSIGVGTILSGEIELDIVAWVNSLRQEGVPVSPRMLALEARRIATAAGVVALRASDKWIKGFRGRHRLSMRAPTRQAQVSPADIDKVKAEFAEKVEKKARQLGITRIYNADQTAAFFEYLPTKKTINARGAKTVWVKCSGASKERATVMLLGDSTGAKYTPFVVFKMQPSKNKETLLANNERRCGFGVRTWPEIKRLKEQTGLQIYSNGKGWWNRDLSMRFLEFHFAQRPSPEEPILLLWDDFSGHWTPEVKAYASSINVVLMKVPPNATSVCQPADVAWNFPFKHGLRQRWIEDLQEQLKRPRKQGENFKLVPPGRAGMCRWIRSSWDRLDARTIANGYKKCNLLLDEECLAAASLVDKLQRLSLAGPVVDAGQDFDRIIEEAVV